MLMVIQVVMMFAIILPLLILKQLQKLGIVSWNL